MAFHNPLSPVLQPAVFQPQRAIAGTSITGTYQIVGSIFGSGIVLLFIISTMDASVQVSFDGVHDFIPVVANSTITIDFRSDGVSSTGQFGVYVKTLGSPSTGSLYVSAISV